MSGPCPAARAVPGALLVLIAAWGVGCATLPADPLADLHPTVLPWRETVQLLTCRWTVAAPVGVGLPEEASDDERRVLSAALEAWNRAGLGLTLREAPFAQSQIRVFLVEDPVARDDGRPGSGRSISDCRVDPEGPAELVSARVEIARRTGPDARGHRRELSAEELAGTAFHEFGHALGFQGHARRGEVPMSASAEVLRRIGRLLLRGETVPSPRLRALYARPSGTRVRTVPVSRWRTDLVDRLAREAARRGFDGPYARVGDVTGRVFWRDASGAEYGVLIANLEETLRDPTRILVLPEARTRALLPRSRDLPPVDAPRVSP